MKLPAAYLILLAGLAACGGSPPAPDWKKDSVSLINKYSKAELKGENKLAERYFEQALGAAASAGRLEETARLNLIRCATRQASLLFEPCNGYLSLAALTPNEEDAAYHRFLSGDWNNLDRKKLPSQYGAFLSSQDDGKRLATLQGISDPLSRLIAISLAILHKQADEGILNLAAETASEQGWRKPLLVYLKLLEKRAAERNDPGLLGQIQTRIKLVESSYSQ